MCDIFDKTKKKVQYIVWEIKWQWKNKIYFILNKKIINIYLVTIIWKPVFLIEIKLCEVITQFPSISNSQLIFGNKFVKSWEYQDLGLFKQMHKFMLNSL